MIKRIQNLISIYKKTKRVVLSSRKQKFFIDLMSHQEAFFFDRQQTKNISSDCFRLVNSPIFVCPSRQSPDKIDIWHLKDSKKHELTCILEEYKAIQILAWLHKIFFKNHIYAPFINQESSSEIQLSLSYFSEDKILAFKLKQQAGYFITLSLEFNEDQLPIPNPWFNLVEIAMSYDAIISPDTGVTTDIVNQQIELTTLDKVVQKFIDYSNYIQWAKSELIRSIKSFPEANLLLFSAHYAPHLYKYFIPLNHPDVHAILIEVNQRSIFIRLRLQNKLGMTIEHALNEKDFWKGHLSSTEVHELLNQVRQILTHGMAVGLIPDTEPAPRKKAQIQVWLGKKPDEQDDTQNMLLNTILDHPILIYLQEHVAGETRANLGDHEILAQFESSRYFIAIKVNQLCEEVTMAIDGTQKYHMSFSRSERIPRLSHILGDLAHSLTKQYQHE